MAVSKGPIKFKKKKVNINLILDFHLISRINRLFLTWIEKKMENGFVLFFGVCIALIVLIRDSREKINAANKVIRAQNHRIRQLEYALMELRSINQKSNPLPFQDKPVSEWKKRWALKTLDISPAHLTSSEIKKARLKALKASHPDVGGSKEKMADVYEAVTYLESLMMNNL